MERTNNLAPLPHNQFLIGQINKIMKHAQKELQYEGIILLKGASETMNKEYFHTD